MNKYLYILKLLPLINANKKFFLEKIAPNPKNLAYFIGIDAPKIISENFNDKAEEVPIKDITADLQQNSSNIVLFVEFDETWPEQNTHCYAIALAISPENNIRLFTYEKGQRFDGSAAYYVGEFDAEGGHINHGTTSEKKISLFSGIIMQELNK